MKKIVLCLLLLFVCGAEVYGHAAKQEVVKDDTIVKLERQALELVEKDDFDSALKLFAGYARSNTENSYYKDQYSILRRVIKMKKLIDSALAAADHNGQTQEKLKEYAQAIRAYYYEKGYYTQAVKLDNQILELNYSAQSVANYLESLVIINDNVLADQLSAANIGSEETGVDFKIMQALLDARNGYSDKAVATIDSMKFSAELYPRCLVYCAAIYKIAGQDNNACSSIVKALENTAPTQMSTTRILIEKLSDLDSIRTTEQYVSALQTESKVYQSGCTGGSSCNSCSLKGSCPSGN